MKIIVAIDSFKGCLTSAEANQAAAEGILSKMPEAAVVQVPVMLMAGRIADEQQLLDAGFTHIACINPPGLPLEIAMQPETAKENIRRTVISIPIKQ